MALKNGRTGRPPAPHRQTHPHPLAEGNCGVEEEKGVVENEYRLFPPFVSFQRHRRDLFIETQRDKSQAPAERPVHHWQRSFHEEYVATWQKFSVTYDERYHFKSREQVAPDGA